MRKLVSSLVVLGALSLTGCSTAAANTFQLVGSMVQGTAAMGSSIIEANSSPRKKEPKDWVKEQPGDTDEMKLARKELDRRLKNVSEVREIRKDGTLVYVTSINNELVEVNPIHQNRLKGYEKEISKFKQQMETFAKLVPLYCKEISTGYNHCIGLDRKAGKILGFFHFIDLGWKTRGVHAYYEPAFNDYDIPTETLEAYRKRGYPEEKDRVYDTFKSIEGSGYEDYTRLGTMSFKDFEPYINKSGYMRYGAVFDAVKGNQSLYRRIVGI